MQGDAPQKLQIENKDLIPPVFCFPLNLKFLSIPLLRDTEFHLKNQSGL